MDIRETSRRPQDEDYPTEFTYHGPDAPCVLRKAWVDVHGGFWLESVDGQHAMIPSEVRNLLAKRVREAKFR